MDLSSRTKKFNQAFRHFLETGEVLPGYTYADQIDGEPVQPRFRSVVFKSPDDISFVLSRAKHAYGWDRRTQLVTPFDWEMKEAQAGQEE